MLNSCIIFIKLLKITTYWQIPHLQPPGGPSPIRQGCKTFLSQVKISSLQIEFMKLGRGQGGRDGPISRRTTFLEVLQAFLYDHKCL